MLAGRPFRAADRGESRRPDGSRCDPDRSEAEPDRECENGSDAPAQRMLRRLRDAQRPPDLAEEEEVAAAERALDCGTLDDILVAIVAQPGSSLDAQGIASWCRERLAPYEMPHYIEFRDMLPKSKVGKLLRRELRAEERRGRPSAGGLGVRTCSRINEDYGERHS